ncbi:hypothetical protein AAC387_Pa04g1328 [Persea americana]
MASGSGSGNDDFNQVVNEGLTPSPPVMDADVRFTAIQEQLVRNHETQVAMQAQQREQMAKSHEVKMGMQAQIASMLQVQSQMQAQLQTPPVSPIQPPPNVGTQVVVQSKEKDPNIFYEQFRKR